MKIVGITAGAFDLLHAGHVLMLQECKKYCDQLIVLLQTDPSIDRPKKNKPVQSLVERQIQVLGCRYVDEVFIYETEKDLKTLLKVLEYDVRIIGADWKAKPFTGHDIPGHLEKVVYNSRKHNWSSTALRNKLKK